MFSLKSLQEKIFLEILIFLHIYYFTLYMHDLNDAWPGRIPRIRPHPTHVFTFKEMNKKSMLNDFNKGLDMGNVLMKAGFDWLA